MRLLEGVRVLALDGLRPSPPHPTHFTIDEAIACSSRIGAAETYLIHLTHDIDHDAFEGTLPRGVKLAYDGLKLESVKCGVGGLSVVGCRFSVGAGEA